MITINQAMTKTELAKILNTAPSNVYPAFAEAGRRNPIIEEKNKLSLNQNVVADFTLEEILYVMQFYRIGKVVRKYGATKIEIEWIKENFIEHTGSIVDFVDREKYLYLDGTREFVKNFKVPCLVRCCNTCKFLVGKTIKNKSSHLRPFCALYDRFLFKMNANVYKDRCNSYVRLPMDKPRVWYSASAPTNKDQYDNISNKVNGIDRSRFISGDKTSDEIVILNQYGFDKSVLE